MLLSFIIFIPIVFLTFLPQGALFSFKVCIFPHMSPVRKKLDIAFLISYHLGIGLLD